MATNATAMYVYFPGTNALAGSATQKEVNGDKAIQISRLSHNVTHTITGSGTGHQARQHGRTDHGDIQFTKYMDQTTPQFLQYCSGGNIIPSAVFQLFHSMQQDANSQPSLFWQYTITDVIVTSVSYSSLGADVPSESITLNYATIEWQHNLQDNKAGGKLKGNVTTQWSLFTNTAAAGTAGAGSAAPAGAA